MPGRSARRPFRAPPSGAQILPVCPFRRTAGRWKRRLDRVGGAW